MVNTKGEETKLKKTWNESVNKMAQITDVRCRVSVCMKFTEITKMIKLDNVQ